MSRAAGFFFAVAAAAAAALALNTCKARAEPSPDAGIIRFLQAPERVTALPPQRLRRPSPLSAPPVVLEALRHEGARWRSRAWCQKFVNQVLARTGHQTTGSARAASVLAFPRVRPVPGAIAFWHRRGGGHSAIVAAVNGGSVTLISGNWGRRVAVHERRIASVAAFVRPVR